MMYTLPSSSFGYRSVFGLSAAFVFSLLFAQMTGAQTYINNQAEYYDEPGPPYVPQINATAFDNQNVFSVTYNVYVNNEVEFCEPWWGTLYYTNSGEMMVNAPIPIAGNGLVYRDTFATTGVGFEFDVQEGNSNVMAGTFYNPGTIHCDSILDTNNIFSFGSFQFASQTSIGDCFVSATNIINPGNIVVGMGGQLNLNGQNVDLTRSVLTLEQGLVNSNNVNADINSEGEGYDTNADWNPFLDLTATNASSSIPDNLYLSFPTSYFGEVSQGPSNKLVRAVFIVNANTNVAANVYIAPANFANEGALIQWSGTFLDSATGLTDTNYLYLYHYYPGSFGLTNLFPILAVGTPAQPGLINAFNYLWSQATLYPGLPAPTTAGFQGNFNDAFITNVYEYFNANLTGTTVGTNASAANPGGALTNLPNKLVINASHELKMDLARIAGENYLSLTATNQFDGSPGALILSPYSDVNLAVTNGYPNLTISNLLAANIPQWGGTLNEWSTRWTNTDINGVAWDYRVVLVYADLTPSINPVVQNLTLTATNLIISDALNVSGSTFANAEILTLTTNAFGSGANSPDGELNMQLENAATWSWNSSFPYVALLTNNGAIRMPNYSDFVRTAQVTNGVPTIPGVSATNILFESGGANVARGSTVFIGGITYTFTNSITKTSPPGFVLIGPKFDASLTNLIAAINFGKGGGVVYSTNETSANASASAGALLAGVPVGITNHGFVITAIIPGTSPGDYIPTSTTATNLVWTNSASGLTLAGGVNPILGYTNTAYLPTNYIAIVNNGFMSDEGATIWTSNFMSSGVISNGSGNFQLTSWTTTLTNGSLMAGGDVTLAADSLLASNLILQAGRSLTLEVTNSFTDGSVSNGSIWSLGLTNAIGFNGKGLLLPFLPSNTANLPVTNNLLGTTIYLQSPPPNKQVECDWAGLDYGANTLGYNTNNMAIGQLILISQAADSDFYFTGPPGSTANNAIYVDRLVLENFAGLAYPNWQGVGGPPTLIFNSNTNAGQLTIYYADALSSETTSGGPLQDVSSILNGLNNGHLVWVPSYMGYFSSTNVPYPDGSIIRLNSGVASGGGNARMDSNGDGTPNSGESDPLFVANQIDFQEIRVGNSNKLTWHSPPGATNFVMYCTTNWANWTVATVVTNSPAVPPPAGWPITNVIYEPLTARMGTNCWYRVKIDQNNSILYGQ